MWYGQDSAEAQAHADVTLGVPHKAKFSHETIAAAASYEAAKAYEHHVAAHGRPVNHEKAVALLAALTGGFIDRMVETKGLDEIDRERAKRDAHRRATEALARSGQY